MLSTATRPQQSGLTTATRTLRPIRQGWLLKRAGSGFLAQWRTKYLVLIVLQINDGKSPLQTKAFLQIFDHIDQSKPPKHEIQLENVELEIVNDMSKSPSAAGYTRLGKKGCHPFILHTSARRFHFAGQSRTDSEDWIKMLASFVKFRNGINPNFSPRVISKAGTMDDLRRNRNNQSLYNNPAATGTLGRNRSMSYRSFREDDMQSLYTNDDAVSIVSSVGGQSLYDGDDSKSIASSSFETLSFCSEPVLTPQELSIMGSPANIISLNKGDTIRRRKVPMFSKSEIPVAQIEKWNDKYQKVFTLAVETQEDALKRDVQLVEIIGLFEETALQHAMKMIDEYHLQSRSSNQKDIKGAPGAISIDGMILHFVCDYDVSSPEEIHIALCRSSNEIRSIDAVNKVSKDLQTALMVLIDYKGFRVVAYADMGIDSKTVPLFDIHAKPPLANENITEKLCEVGRLLNLKGHGVQVTDDQRINVHLSAEVQVHHDREMNYFYTVNLFQLFPMDFHPPVITPVSSPTRSSNSSKSNHQPLLPLPQAPSQSRRLRPEYLSAYTIPISADAFTNASGCGRREKDMNDQEAARASRFLHEHWIPAFVRKLDQLEVRPVDSRHVSLEMHRHGVNVRYLGIIALTSSIPYIRDLVSIEMVARAVKSVFRSKLRGLIIHFRSVGATQVDDEMKSWVANMFSVLLTKTNKSNKYFEDKIRPEILHKYNFDMSFSHFSALHRPSLFLAMQYQCGVQFDDTTNYPFDDSNPCPPTTIKAFVPKTKRLSGSPKFPELNPTVISEDDRLAYHLARHFRSLGPKSKLLKSDTSSLQLCQCAAHYNATGRHEEARRYAMAAIAAAGGNTSAVAIAKAQLLEALGALQSNPMPGPDSAILEVYQSGVSIVHWNCGAAHPLGMALHDRMCQIHMRGKRYSQALDFHLLSLEMALTSLGKNHTITAGYLTKAGILLGLLKQTDDAINRLNEALHIFKSLNASSSLISEVHFHLADALDARGDLDAAISNSQQSRRLREKSHGQMDSRSVATCMQLAYLVLKPYDQYAGVLTPVIRNAYREAISCYEKVFRYLKAVSVGQRGTGRGSGGTWSSNASIISGTASVRSMSISGRSQKSDSDEKNGGLTNSVVPICGPALVSPFAPLPAMPKSVLHKITRKIIALKLALLESPRHKEIVRMIRMAASRDTGSTGIDGEEQVPGTVFDSESAREVILKMAAVSPSIYLDGLLARIDDEDVSAEEELAIVLHIAESETLGLSA